MTMVLDYHTHWCTHALVSHKATAFAESNQVYKLCRRTCQQQSSTEYLLQSRAKVGVGEIYLHMIKSCSLRLSTN